MLRNTIQHVLRSRGYEIVKVTKEDSYMDMETDFRELYEKCRAYTMTSIERMYALYKSIEYIVKNNVKGDLVECGVWRGGSSMLMTLTLKKFQAESRKVYLYDTFEGMSAPSEHDVDLKGETASSLLKHGENNKENSVWCLASLEDVRFNIYQTGYPKENILLIKGKVEDTIPYTMPSQISLLRLDTDWYESTHHELIHLYPLLSSKGILIMDDYGHWQGAKKATDDYFSQKEENILLNRIDYTGRIGIKP